MLRDIWVIYAKELREVVRDRRTLVFMILLPILIMPVLAGAVSSWMSDVAERESGATLRYAIVEPALAPQLVDALADDPSFAAVDDPSLVRDGSAAIRGGELDFVLTLTSGAAGQVEVELAFENSRMTSKVRTRVEALVASVNEVERERELVALGVATPEARAAVIEPMRVVARGIATKREVVGEAMGGVLPYVFIVFCFLGALYPAADLGAGEKERGTLETLLLAPVSRSSLVLGKFLVLFTTGTVSALLGTASLGVWLASQGSGEGKPLGAVMSSIGVGDLASIACLLVPLAAVIASLLLSLSIFARSFKEAQAYAGPLNLLLLLPAFVAMLPGATLDWRWAMVPISNVALGIKEAVKGSLDPAMFALILASSFVLAGAALLFCERWFRRETVLFRR